jgi:hypothetical protein
LVEDPSYFQQLLAYIHLNAVNAGIVEDPSAYRWSGHREILGVVKAKLTDVDEVLVGFAGTVRAAREAYAGVLGRIGEESWIGEALPKLAWWRVEEEREIQLVDRAPHVDVQGRSTGIERPELTGCEYLQSALGLLGVDPAELGGRSQRPGVVQLRELVAVLGVKRYGQAVKDIAEVLGRSRSTVSSWVRRGAAKRAASAAFRDEVDALDRRIAGLQAHGTDVYLAPVTSERLRQQATWREHTAPRESGGPDAMSATGRPTARRRGPCPRRRL